MATASARGSAHQRLGLPNQDAVDYVLAHKGSGQCTVVAVSDGHGGARHFRSQVGSTLAVHAAITVIQEFLRSPDALGPAEGREARLEGLNRHVVDAWLSAVQQDLEHNPLTQEELQKLEAAEDTTARESIKQNPNLAYGCTLLVATASQTLVLCMQLGDGDILVVDPQGRTARPLPRDGRLVANQTTSLCQADAWREMRSVVLENPDNFPSLILLSTDGYMNSFRTEEDFLQIGKDYLAILREQGIDALSQELPKILAEASQHGSGDDITLAILQGDVSHGAPIESAAPTTNAASASKTPHGNPSLSKSILYEQLRAKHSAQQREIQKLSDDVAETRNRMRRLKIASAVLVLLAIAVPGYYYWHVHGKATASLPADGAMPDVPTIADRPPASGDRPPGSGTKSSPAEAHWVLSVGGDQQIRLGKNAKIVMLDNRLLPSADVQPKRETYAEVQELKGGGLRLMNRSKDGWEQLDSNGDPSGDKKIKKNEGLVLADGITIKFRNGLEGRISISDAGS